MNKARHETEREGDSFQRYHRLTKFPMNKGMVVSTALEESQLIHSRKHSGKVRSYAFLLSAQKEEMQC
jgi:hypothetical protein